MQRHGTCFILENKTDYVLFGGAHPYIITRAVIAVYRTQSHDGRSMSYFFRTNVVVYRTISYKHETDRAKRL